MYVLREEDVGDRADPRSRVDFFVEVSRHSADVVEVIVYVVVRILRSILLGLLLDQPTSTST